MLENLEKSDLIAVGGTDQRIMLFSFVLKHISVK